MLAIGVKPSPKMYCALLMACLLASAVGESDQHPADIAKLLVCMSRNTILLLSRDSLCAMTKMYVTYIQMKAANCTNCDKYFHCLSNSRAVNECGNSTKAREATEAIGDCFWKGDLAGADNAANQEAYLFGRDGGDCKHEYLAAVSCAFNPDTKRCS